MTTLKLMMKSCIPHPNKTYDSFARINDKFAIFYKGNSLMLRTDPENMKISNGWEKIFFITPEQKVQLLMLESTQVQPEESK